jgi:pSer/pThr/pTyr-binding forkhead associated (FHA) protein
MAPKQESRCFLVSKDLVIPLTSEHAVVLGRDPGMCNFVLPDARISRVHTLVGFKDGHYFIKDLNSSNGTFLTGRRVQGVQTLSAGDIIELRPFSLEFVRPDYAQVYDALAQPAESDEAAKSSFAGSLKTLSIADLIQLLNSTRQSGLLTISGEGSSSSDLVFVDGEIVQAHYEGLAGEEAVYAALRNRVGNFEFTKTAPRSLQGRIRAQPAGGGVAAGGEAEAGDQTIRRRTLSLLLEGCRQLDESGAPPDPSAPAR